jgi:hypothetical protein
VSYCKTIDVEAINSQRKYNNETNPTKLELEDKIIVNIGNMIDNRLKAAGFTTPITGVISLAKIKTICAIGSASLAELSSSKGGEKKNVRAETLWNLFNEDLERIEETPEILSDAEFSPGVANNPGDSFCSNYTESTDKDSLSPVFKKDDVF